MKVKRAKYFYNERLKFTITFIKQSREYGRIETDK